MDLASGKTYSSEVFKQITVESSLIAQAIFTDCRFVKCVFRQVDFSGSDFTDCVFEGCEMSSPMFVNTGFHGAVFQSSKLVGVDFTKSSVHLFRLGFLESLIDTCNFSSLKMKKTPFERCTIRDSRFVGTVLSESNFEGSDLYRTNFHECDLEKAIFTRAKNYAIDPRTNRLKGAIFSLPEAVSLLLTLGIELDSK